MNFYLSPPKLTRKDIYLHKDITEENLFNFKKEVIEDHLKVYGNKEGEELQVHDFFFSRNVGNPLCSATGRAPTNIFECKLQASAWMGSPMYSVNVWWESDRKL